MDNLSDHDAALDRVRHALAEKDRRIDVLRAEVKRLTDKLDAILQETPDRKVAGALAEVREGCGSNRCQAYIEPSHGRLVARCMMYECRLHFMPLNLWIEAAKP